MANMDLTAFCHFRKVTDAVFFHAVSLNLSWPHDGHASFDKNLNDIRL